MFGKDVSTKKDVAIKASPMYHMDKVATGASIALYHGEDDPRAPIQHSYNILKELKSKGIAGEMVAFEGALGDDHTKTCHGEITFPDVDGSCELEIILLTSLVVVINNHKKKQPTE